MIENEFKIMLDRGQYEKIHALFAWDAEMKQVNSYYDSPGLECSSRHITVRVRSISGENFLQMKLPAEQSGNGAVSRIELEQKVSGLPQKLEPETLKSLSGADLPELTLLGTLSTFRSVKKFPGAEIDLDRSEYFDVIDYELEVEYTDEAAAEAILAEIWQKVRIDRSAPVTGKIRRFLQEYQKNNA